MTWLLVTRKDVADTIRSRAMWTISVVLTLATAGVAMQARQSGRELELVEATHYLTLSAEKLVPLVALLVGYLALAGERESGSMKILLGIVGTRSDVFIGKFVGRACVVAAGITAAFLIGAAVIATGFGTVAVGSLVAVIAVTVLFGFAYVGIAVGISGLTTSGGRAAAASMAVFFVFNVAWRPLLSGLHQYIDPTLRPGDPLPMWYVALDRLNPESAYLAALEATPGAGSAWFKTPSSARVSGEIPMYLQDWTGLIVLIVWMLVPLLVGFVRFKAVDLR